MKLNLYAWVMTACVLGLSACAVVPTAGVPGPSVWIDAPLIGELPASGTIGLVVHAGGASAVSSFEMRVNDSVIDQIDAGSDPRVAVRGSPALWTLRTPWTPPGPGTYRLAIRAEDPEGRWGDPAILLFTSQAATPTEAATALPTATGTSAPTLTPTPSPLAIGQPSFSPERAYYHGTSCGATQLSVTVGVSHPSAGSSVDLFYRFKNAATGEAGEWQGERMNPSPSGTFARTLSFAGASGGVLSTFPEVGLQVQFVLTDASGKQVRSEVMSPVGLSPCQ
ncbi:MAG: hypothetical protein MUO23_12075 [Anaerolineales bacterium]|nr:hypothetical protein [Anaerolineales bacterium]